VSATAATNVIASSVVMIPKIKSGMRGLKYIQALPSREEQESPKAGQAELPVRQGVVLSVLDWRLRAGDTLLRGRLSSRRQRRRFDRHGMVRRHLGPGLSGVYGLRCYVGQCRRGNASLYRSLRNFLQGFVRGEQQHHQHETQHRKKG
jgi:hypothetical protein